MRSRVYYRLELELRSALSIGAADSTMTDHDVIIDSRGLPLIPATSLAGVFRSYFDETRALEMFGEVLHRERERLLGGMSGKERERILGNDGSRCDESAVRIYDATWVGGSRVVMTRDGVALKDRVVRDKLKFDRQAVERGARFVTFVEIVDVDRCPPSEIEKAFGALHVGDLLLGSKTTRGYGSVAVLNCRKRSFESKDVEEWLSFDMFAGPGEPSWALGSDMTEAVHATRATCDVEIRLDLSLRGGISIREYSTEPGMEGIPQFDYSHMVVHDMKDGKGDDVPILLGTSWAGAFRERYESFSSTDAARALFGCVGSDDDAEDNMRSRIQFGESVLRDGCWVLMTHNAIDRFTGGTIDSALYTERTYFGGVTTLSIRIDDMGGFGAEAFEPLVCTLADLNNGMLAVGGLASIGRGLFRIDGATLTVGGTPREGFYEALCGNGPLDDGCIGEIKDVGAAARMLCREGDV